MTEEHELRQKLCLAKKLLKEALEYIDEHPDITCWVRTENLMNDIKHLLEE